MQGNPEPVHLHSPGYDGITLDKVIRWLDKDRRNRGPRDSPLSIAIGGVGFLVSGIVFRWPSAGLVVEVLFKVVFIVVGLVLTAMAVVGSCTKSMTSEESAKALIAEAREERMSESGSLSPSTETTPVTTRTSNESRAVESAGPISGILGNAKRVIADVKCTKCDEQVRIQLNLAKGQALAEGCKAYPKDDLLRCAKCGEEHNLSGLRKQVEMQCGKGVVLE